ncbi:SGNH hydrolase domain-containing protein, partial [Acinetobacter pittii]
SNLSNVDRFILFERNLKNTLCRISKKNPVYIIQPIPELGFNAPKRIIKNRFHNSNKETSISYRDYLIRSEKTRKIINRSAVDCGVTVLDPSKILCKTGKCISEYKGRPIYRDGDHLSEYGNKLLKPMFREALEKY